MLETEGDVWRQLASVEREAAMCTVPLQKSQMQLHMQRLRGNLHQRSKSMYDLREYRDIVLNILQFPGLRQQFRAKSLEIFLRGRTIEVISNSHLFANAFCIVQL